MLKHRKIVKQITGWSVCLACFLWTMTAVAAFHGGTGSGGQYHFADSVEASEAEQEETAKTETKQAETTAAETKQADIADTETTQEKTAAQSASKKTVCSSPTTAADTGTGALTWEEDGQTYYQFAGKKYVIKEDWGVHYLTGFSPESTGSSKTHSGAYATSNYTAASTSANLNKVILVKAEGGTGSTALRNRYDGIYKCQDTGGAAVEYGLSTTGGVPVVDLFFDTAAEAYQVSGKGWIFARIYILEEVK